MESRDYWKVWLLGSIPDIALSWGYMKLSDDRWASLGWFLVALTVAQAFFGIKRIAAGSLVFRLYGKERISDALVQEMHERQFPLPIRDERFGDEDFESYMARLVEDETIPVGVRLRANAYLASFQAQNAQGFFVSLRLTAAFNLAVKKYFDTYA